nr:FHA domain-containing protein [Nitrosomonas nitrosa]
MSPMQTVVAEPALPNPYRGVHPFRYIDRQYFFGREAVVDDLLIEISLYRLVLLFGESGAGKSSIINAGLIPALKGKGFNPERLRVSPETRDQPILVEQIEASEGRDSAALPSIFDGLHAEKASLEERTPCSIDAFLNTIREKAQEARPVLIFDQFEELFTLFESRGENGKPDESVNTQKGILRTIVTLATEERLKVKLLIIIREDWLGKLELLSKSYPQVFDHRVRLGNLDRGNARQAIIGPFQKNKAFHSRLTEGLADSIVSELSSEDVKEEIHATQLQIVCDQLWKKYASSHPEIAENEFRVEGGVKGISEFYLTSQLEKLGPSSRAKAVKVLGHLITDSGTRDVVNDERLKRLLNAHSQLDVDTLRITLGLLEHQRIINRTTQRGTDYYEVASEYLIAPIKREKESLRLDVELTQQRNRWILRLAAVLGISLATFISYALLIGYESWVQIRPWGYLTNLSTGRHFPLSGHLASVGRNTESFENLIGLAPREVSRIHLLISENLSAFDMRSLNGTTVNANSLPYMGPSKLKDGDLIVLAGIAPFQFNKVDYMSVQFFVTLLTKGSRAAIRLGCCDRRQGEILSLFEQ